MVKKEHIEKHTASELEVMRKGGKSRSDWAKAAAMTSEEIEASVAGDEAGMVMDWGNASVELPQPKAVLNMRVDQDVLDFFRRTGRGYQTRINAVLRTYVASMRHGRH